MTDTRWEGWVMPEETRPCLGCKKAIPTDGLKVCDKCDLMQALADSLGVKLKSRAPAAEQPQAPSAPEKE